MTEREIFTLGYAEPVSGFNELYEDMCERFRHDLLYYREAIGSAEKTRYKSFKEVVEEITGGVSGGGTEETEIIFDDILGGDENEDDATGEENAWELYGSAEPAESGSTNIHDKPSFDLNVLEYPPDEYIYDEHHEGEPQTSVEVNNINSIANQDVFVSRIETDISEQQKIADILYG